MTLFPLLGGLALAGLVWLRPRTAEAHCDTMDGPAVADGRLALATGNINHALKWLPAVAEAELREVFTPCLRARALGPDARTVADRLFLETMIRLHRAGEGEAFTGLKPPGSPVAPVVAAADRAIAAGSIEPLRELVPAERLAELERRLQAALALRDYEVDDVEAARRYIGAYVAFFTYAEGEEHHQDEPHQAHGEDHHEDPGHGHRAGAGHGHH